MLTNVKTSENTRNFFSGLKSKREEKGWYKAEKNSKLAHLRILTQMIVFVLLLDDITEYYSV